MPQLLMTTPEIVPCSHLRQIGGHQFGPSPNRRSPVWKYYELELINEDGVLKAVCKYCGSKMTTRRKTEIVEYKIVLKRYATSQQQPFPTEDEWSKAESIGYKIIGKSNDKYWDGNYNIVLVIRHPLLKLWEIHLLWIPFLYFGLFLYL
ncbi:hypothetical protein GQ55_2G419900 [Panicum hallii var. hallii]|uniref:BED-type domain-containing protein n=1 Tax=Panicum hallii var. hallii TaxID=1504633 RepID=A0A2T7EY54_9POAL|nr:hypothetical protein GQ55_2G419900 [Panicum hallii var. hallii]PUZ72754.1 hypothetical protein GQ55_2G419900 [Panicum hallii var. hallii]